MGNCCGIRIRSGDTYVFGGVTGVGTTLIVAFLIRAGNEVLKAVLLTGLGAEPVAEPFHFFWRFGCAGDTAHFRGCGAGNPIAMQD